MSISKKLISVKVIPNILFITFEIHIEEGYK